MDTIEATEAKVITDEQKIGENNTHNATNNNENEIMNISNENDHFSTKRSRKQRSKYYKNKYKKRMIENTNEKDNNKNNKNNNKNNDKNNDNIQNQKQIPKQQKQILKNNNKSSSIINNSKKNYCFTNNNQKKIQTLEEIMIQQEKDSFEQNILEETSSTNDDESIQHLLLESLIQPTSQKPLVEQNGQNTNELNTNTSANNDQINNEKIMNNDTDKVDNDYAFAFLLQEDENEKYQQILSKMHANGKNTKVNTIDFNHFYYSNQYKNDIEDENENDITPVEETTNFGSSHVITSGTSLRHDSKVWNKKYVERLNQYDIFANLNDEQIHFNSQSYNSFRNALDKKGFKTFENGLM